MIERIENEMIPKGSVDLIGLGRLGIRTGINLIQVHRGGPKIISAFDGQKISSSDLFFTMNGAKIGEYKTDFLKRISTHPQDFRKIISVKKNVDETCLNLIKGDIVVLEIAGGDTISTSAEIIKKAHEIGAKTIGTGGVFGIGRENIVSKDISEFNRENIVVELLREQGIKKNHHIVTTNKFIESGIPITPYVLDNIANTITMEILNMLIELNK